MSVNSKAAQAAVYNDKVVRQFSIMAVVWGVVGMLVGVIIAAQLTWPELNLGISWLSYGRLRPLHTNAVIFAFGGSVLFATSYYVVQRTCQVRLFAGPLAAFTMDDRDRYELKIAGLLHDCGKVTTPEYVVDKASKLETIYNRLHEVRTRFEVRAYSLAGGTVFRPGEIDAMLSPYTGAEVGFGQLEAARAFGCTPRQMLTRVQLPLATSTIMAGLNQTLMLSLSMVVIASMISVGGLGQMVLRGIGRLDMGLATVGGLGIVLLAIVLDRITQGLGRSGRERGHRRVVAQIASR